jgi:hypothetical protein
VSQNAHAEWTVAIAEHAWRVHMLEVCIADFEALAMHAQTAIDEKEARERAREREASADAVVFFGPGDPRNRFGTPAKGSVAEQQIKNAAIVRGRDIG